MIKNCFFSFSLLCRIFLNVHINTANFFFRVNIDFNFRFSFKPYVLTVCTYHVTCAFQHESALYSCLNVKELLAWNRRKIWSWNDCNYTRTYNHLACKQALNHLAKLACNVRDMIKTYSQMHCTDKYSQHSASSPVDFIHVLASDV